MRIASIVPFLDWPAPILPLLYIPPLGQRPLYIPYIAYSRLYIYRRIYPTPLYIISDLILANFWYILVIYTKKSLKNGFFIKKWNFAIVLQDGYRRILFFTVATRFLSPPALKSVFSRITVLSENRLSKISLQLPAITLAIRRLLQLSSVYFRPSYPIFTIATRF